jgi:hypothetical protein
VQDADLEAALTAAFRRLVKGRLLSASNDGLSVRLPRTGEMLLATWLENGRDMMAAHVHFSPFSASDSIAALHAGIYLARPDTGGVAVSSPLGIGLLAQRGEALPPLFDEQVRHVGPGRIAILDEKRPLFEQVRRTFGRGANAALLGQRLVCIGITCERAVFNTELLEKCAQAYALVKACGGRASVIPAWVRTIAYRRLKRDQRQAEECYLGGRIPDPAPGYLLIGSLCTFC